MNANRVEYHEGAAADVRQALAWYQKQNRKVTLDFLEELYRATRILWEAPERLPTGKAGQPGPPN